MSEQERDVEIIALLSNVIDGYTYVETGQEVVEHTCEKTGGQKQIELIEVEYFRDGLYKEDKANFCEDCKQVFVYKTV